MDVRNGICTHVHPVVRHNPKQTDLEWTIRKTQPTAGRSGQELRSISSIGKQKVDKGRGRCVVIKDNQEYRHVGSIH